ncbi:DUF58 domain-containing protein [Portibacter marinus]|uniref:DUF58 domain-containing protein n=1 Tax=Portibacter marinus TaxID=2898660 RepID=UPI001F4636E5|nr:DUF58 domain-containing protein [Portibacter marinus]
MGTRKAQMIDPSTIQSLKNFEWISKILAKGFMQGKHSSGRLGQGMEFQQYRNYLPGDDIRNIDWKMFAKTEKLYIKQSIIETEHHYHFIIDNSRSMLYEENGWSKLMLAKILTSSMMRIVANQGDRFSWQASEENMPRGSGMKHWHYAIEKLYNLTTSTTSLNLHPGFLRNATIIYMSDFYDQIEVLQSQFKLLKNPLTEVVLFHILGTKEKSLTFGRNTTFLDLESGEKLNVNAVATQSQYQKRLLAHLNALNNICLALGIHLEECLMNRSITECLRQFFHVYQQNNA